MFKLSPYDRLSRWKEFRLSINNLTLQHALQNTIELWAPCPFRPYYLDPNEPKHWPDPWQLILENNYCDIAKSLGIVYTLYLSDHKSILQPEIRAYYNLSSKCIYHIAYLNQGKYVLNLVEDQVVNKEHINQEFKLVRCYTAADLQLEKY